MITIAHARLDAMPDKLDSIECRGLIDALTALGNELTVITSMPKKVDQKKLKEVIPVLKVEINPEEDLIEEAQVYKVNDEEKYYISSQTLNAQDDQDEIARVFSLATVEALKQLDIRPKILHAQGWQAALIAENEDFHTVFGVSNIEVDEMGVEGINFVVEGIKNADAVIVGAKSEEVPTNDMIAKALSEKESGIFTIPFPLNDEFDPAEDDALEANFGKDTSKERPKNFSSFVLEHKLKKGLKTVVVGLTGDLNNKGGETIVDTIEGLAANNIRVIGAVTVSDEGKKAIDNLKDQYPDLIGIKMDADFDDMRKAAAASDVVLFAETPSQSSILPMLAMRYGALPVAPNKGVYKEIIEDYNPNRESGTGFLYDGDSKYNLLAAVVRAQELKKFPYDWNGLVDSAQDMRMFWRDSAKEIIDLYRQVLGITDDADKGGRSS